MHYFKRRLMFLTMCGLIVLTGLFYQSANRATNVVPTTTPSNETVPIEKLTLTGLDEETYTLSQWMERPLIVTFFASWCEVCAETMPTLATFYHEEKDQLQMIAINATTEERRKSDVQSFVQSAKVTFPVFYDETGEAMAAFELIGVPATFILDTDGTIHETFYGPVSPDRLKNAAMATQQK